MTTVWTIQDHEEILGVFSTKDLANTWLEAHVRKQRPNDNVAWRNGELGSIRDQPWGPHWYSQGMTSREIELDQDPPQ